MASIHGHGNIEYSTGERYKVTCLLKWVHAVLRDEVQLLTLKKKWGSTLTLNFTGTSQAELLLCQVTSRSKHYSLWFTLMTEVLIRTSRHNYTTSPHPRKAKQSKPNPSIFNSVKLSSLLFGFEFFNQHISISNSDTHMLKLLLTQLSEKPAK